MRTLPDPRWDSRRPVPAVLWGDGTPGVSIPPSPSTTQTHSQQPLRVVVDGMCPSTEWQRTTPRLRESSGGAQPARRKNRFIRPPWRPNTEILPQSAGPDNPESRSGAYRGTRTIAIPPCRRSFFYHRTHRIRLRRTQKEVGKRCRPGTSTTTLSQGTRSVASARLPTCPFLTQKWYRPGARCTRAALGAWRPNAEGSQRVATDWETSPIP